MLLRTKGLLRTILSTLVMTLLFSSARGDHLASLEERFTGGEGARISAGLEIAEYPGLSGSLLEKVNAWLAESGLTAETVFRDGIQTDHLLFTFDGTDVLEVWTRETPEDTLAVFGEKGRAYRSRDPGARLLWEMAGSGPLPILLPDAGEIFTGRLVPRFYEILGGGTADVSEETGPVRVKSVGTSPMQTVYSLTQEEAQALWPGMVSFFGAAGAGILTGASFSADALSALGEVRFSSPLTVKRLYDGDGLDMGIQASGKCLPGDGSERKLSLTAGLREGAALYVSLSLTPVRGSLTDKWVFSAVRKASSSAVTWTVDGSVSRTDEDGRTALELSGNVKEALGDDADRISGKVTLTGRVRGIRKTWILRPEISVSPEGLEGTVRFTAGTAGETDTDMTVRLSAGLCVPEEMPLPTDETDISALGEKEREALLAGETLPILRVWLYHMEALTYEEREGIAHILRNDAWMNGPVTVSPSEGMPETDNDNEWSVEEDSL